MEEYCVPGERLTPTTTVKHGSESAYVLGCRGEHCREAHKIFHRRYADARKAYRARIREELEEYRAWKAAQQQNNEESN
jgi:hypothetical protein